MKWAFHPEAETEFYETIDYYEECESYYVFAFSGAKSTAVSLEKNADYVSIILSPVDFRTRDLPSQKPPAPAWSTDLYNTINKELKTFGQPIIGETVMCKKYEE